MTVAGWDCFAALAMTEVELRMTLLVIARSGATKQSQIGMTTFAGKATKQSQVWDCFAPLAMTL